MVSPKDNFTNEYTQEEINELKTAYDALATYKEKVRFFDDYFSIEVSGFIEQVEIFEFPFPSQGKHSKNDVERLEMILSSATASQFLEKTFFDIAFSLQPTTADEWFYINRYLMTRKFDTPESLKENFWKTLASVPEQEYFIQTQIGKFNLFDTQNRQAIIPFHVEYYNVFQENTEFHPHLNNWYTLFTAAYSLARREGIIKIPTDSRLLYDLYFTSLGFVYAHYLGFLKRCLADVAEKGPLAIPGQISGTVDVSEKDEQSGPGKAEFSHKSQLLLLHRLGILDLPVFASLTDIQRGKLFGGLLNRNPDNTENYIRYRHGGRDVNPKYALSNSRSVQPVEVILRECGLENM